VNGLAVRAAAPGDAEALAGLIVMLGYDATAADVRARLAAIEPALAPLVGLMDGAIVGCLSLSLMRVLHRPRPVGRISMFVVDARLRGRGIGAAMLAEAESRLAALGCGLVEVTSNMKRGRAHSFYERLGYERTSYRFAKALA
jgi:ribosomal protein S18 acetylase RimI-like enzyme